MLHMQCDEGKPNCERCCKRDQTCPGYRDPNTVRFIHQRGRRRPQSSPSVSQPCYTTLVAQDCNEDASIHETRHANRQTRSDKLTSNVSKQVLHQYTLNTPPSSLLGQPRIQNWEEQATCFFFHGYTLQSSHNDNPGWLDFLPEMYQKSDSDSALAHSTRAMSFTSLSSASSLKHLATKGHQSYGLALKKINASLRKPNEVLEDSLIVSVLLLALFEVRCFSQVISLYIMLTTWQSPEFPPGVSCGFG
jgi:hypothetical protein